MFNKLLFNMAVAVTKQVRRLLEHVEEFEYDRANAYYKTTLKQYHRKDNEIKQQGKRKDTLEKRMNYLEAHYFNLGGN